VVNAATDAPPWTAAVIASGNTLEALVAAGTLGRLPSFDPGLRRVADVLAFIGIAVFCLKRSTSRTKSQSSRSASTSA
jgi:integral membrane sensor domain MASE1